MRGDVIIIKEWHVNAAKKIVDHILSITGENLKRKYAISVFGESGAGKSEIAKAMSNVFQERSIKTTILQQDDYYIFPPKTNDEKRRYDPDWYGPDEVRLHLLERHVKATINGLSTIIRPLVNYHENRIDKEAINLETTQLLIIEGTYVGSIDCVDFKVFIDRDWNDTREDRIKRNRENNDPFIENILQKEHEVVCAHKKYAQIIITKNYDIEYT